MGHKGDDEKTGVTHLLARRAVEVPVPMMGKKGKGASWMGKS